MSDTPFTDNQLHRAAADLHHALATSPIPVDADQFLSRHPAWDASEAGLPSRVELRARVADLVTHAADTSEWAVELGALGLTPYNTHAWRTNEGVDVAVQLAAGAAMKPAFRNEVARAVQGAVEDVYAKYLGQVPRAHVPAATR